MRSSALDHGARPQLLHQALHLLFGTFTIANMRVNRRSRFIAGSRRASIAMVSALCVVATRPALAQRTTMEIIGHRGAAGLAPENTLAAFRRACAIGVAGIELDVHLTADSVLVVHHDYALHPDLARNASGDWIDAKQRPDLRTLTLAQIRTYDLGRLRPGSDYAKRHPDQVPSDNERLPTFDEVISLFLKECAPPTRLVVEIKDDPTNPSYSAPPILVAERTVAQLKTRGVAARSQIIAFDWTPLKRVREIAPEMSTSHLTFEGKDWNTIEIGKAGPSAWMGGMDIDDHGGSVPRAIKAAGGKNWSPNWANVTPELIAEAHALGLKVYVWTVNNAVDMEKMIALGVDGITTDRPDILRELLAKR